MDNNSLKKQAQILYSEGKTQKYIMDKLNIPGKKLNLYIIESAGNTKTTVLYLFYSGWTKNEICRELNIDINILNNYLDNSTKNNLVEFKKTDVQDGFLDWVTQIINNSRKVS